MYHQSQKWLFPPLPPSLRTKMLILQFYRVVWFQTTRLLISIWLQVLSCLISIYTVFQRIPEYFLWDWFMLITNCIYIQRWCMKVRVIVKIICIDPYPVEEVNPFPNNDTFWPPWNKPLENTVGKREIARNPFWYLSAVFIKYEIVVCSLSVWKSLKFVDW